MVAAIYGSLPEFHPDSESIKSYIGRVNIFFRANLFLKRSKLLYFLSCIGGNIYYFLRSVLAPNTIAEATLKVLITTLEDHFESKPNIISESSFFLPRNQKAGEI